MTANPTDRTRNLVLLVAILALGWWAYAPGLHGSFLFDDFANLPALGAYGPITDSASFWRYLTSGGADITGRPVALLTFLLDAQSWPADPYPFKRTNLILHLLNGVLLAWLLTLLGRQTGETPAPGAAGATNERALRHAAILAAALWLLHPLFVSTTLYVVQREAMLPATFVLLGLIGFAYARALIVRGQRGGFFYATAIIGTTTLLATMSKGNGALLPLLAWLLDAVLLSPRQPMDDPRRRTLWRYWRWLMLMLPTMLVLGWLATTAYTGFTQGLEANRPWTLYERLLTQNRVLVDYLLQLWLPRPYTLGLFNDAVAASRGWLQPITTLACALLLAGLLVLASYKRRSHPVAAFAVLFFFAAHLMESSVVPLELYFEHRNYLPALPMFWPLALWLCGTDARLRGLRRALALTLPLGFALLTRLGAGLWGNTQEQGLLWALRNPDSPRAQVNAAHVEAARGHPDAAAARLVAARRKNPDDVAVALNLIGVKCRLGGPGASDIADADTALRETRNLGRLGFEWFDQGLGAVQSGTCPGLTLDTLDRLLDAAQANPRSMKVPGRRQDLHHLRARIALRRSDGDRALGEFNAALDAKPTPQAALAQAAALGASGFPAQALAHLDHLADVWQPQKWSGVSMMALHQWLLVRQGYWEHEIAHLRGVLEEDIRLHGQPPQPGTAPAGT